MQRFTQLFIGFGIFASIAALDLAQTWRKSPEESIPTGTIQLRVMNRACGAVAVGSSTTLNPNPREINDGKLDPAERIAIEEGCALQAVAIAPNGMPITDTPLVLLRSEAPAGTPEVVAQPRSSDANGAAEWRFRLTPNTDFIYEVMSPNPAKRTARSNAVEIQLCTGAASLNQVRGAILADAGRGCR